MEMKSELIVPCGMNCALCRAYLRDKNPCHGCFAADQNMPKTRVDCKIRNCAERKGRFCFECDKFPCERVTRIDTRYRDRYGMSEIENLQNIQKNGIGKFLESEEKKWVSDEGTHCVHDGKRYRHNK